MNKVLGVDYGQARTGLAISDEHRVIAFKHTTLHEKDSDKRLSQIREIVSNNNIDTLIVGVPLGRDGKPTQISIEIDEFIVSLETLENVKIVKWNEVMTSRLAKQNKEHIKYKKGDLDSESARIILQEYLDYSKYNI